MIDQRSQAKTVRLLRMISMLAIDHSPRRVNRRFNTFKGMLPRGHTADGVCERTTTRDLATLKADMTRHFRGNGELAIVRTVRDFNKCDRMQAKLVRILRLIVLLAGSGRPLQLREINAELDAVTGTTWCRRTIRRDVVVLKSLGMITETGEGFAIAKPSQSCERLQIVANDIFKKDNA